MAAIGADNKLSAFAGLPAKASQYVRSPSTRMAAFGGLVLGFVTAGKLGRFAPQYVFNLAVFWLMLSGEALNRAGMASVGGAAGAALVTTLA